MTANKYYVVWVGAAPGVYDSWDEAQVQIAGYPGASYRSFNSQEEATKAFRDGYDKNMLISDVAREIKKMNAEGRSISWSQPVQNAPQAPIQNSAAKPAQTANPNPNIGYAQVAGRAIMPSIAVDAACSGNPGPMEYQGVLLPEGRVIFKIGPMAGGTNNIGEFLAIVHALALQDKQGTNLPIYSDSVNAQIWVKNRLCKTKLTQTDINAPIFDLIRRAERWLLTHKYNTPIYKWDTKAWGEIPADFGRK